MMYKLADLCFSRN